MAPPPPPKRVIRTYGRPKELALVETVIVPTRSSTPPLNRFTRRRSPSPADDGASDALFKYRGGSSIRSALAAIDAQYDSEEESQPAPQPVVEKKDDTTTSPIQDTHASSPNPERHSPPSTFLHRDTSNRVAFSDDDSDAENQTSPAKHPIHTPKSRRSSTPPTSDDELPERLSVGSKPKPKAKPVNSRAPLAFRADTRKVAPEGSSKKPKIKAPTKKELDETRRERGRIAAETKTGLQRVEKPARYTMSNLFQGLTNPGLSALGRTASLDDPITNFSSSPQPPPIPIPRNEDQSVAPPPFLAPEPQRKSSDLPPLDDSDDDLPDASILLTEAKQGYERAQRQQELADKKAMLVAQQRTAPPPQHLDDDDDDLIVQPKPKSSSSLEKKPRLSEARKRQMLIGEFGRASGSRGITQMRDQVMKDLKRQVQRDTASIVNEKEDEWARRGGTVMTTGASAVQNSVMMDEAIKAIAERGKITAEAREARMQLDHAPNDGDDDDSDDEDWQEDAGDADITMVEENEEEEDNDEAPIQTAKGRSKRLVIDSDDEQENDQGDKENDGMSMFDPTADKENEGIRRQPLGSLLRPKLVGRQSSLLGLEEGFSRRMSMSPGDVAEDENENAENVRPDNRRALTRLSSDEDLFISEPASHNLQFAERLKRSSPTSTQPGTPELTLRPTLEPEPFGAKLKSIEGFSQFSDDDSVTKPTVLQPGFSDLFEAGSEQQPQRQSESRGASFRDKSLFDQLRKPAVFGLTQDVELQPAFEVGDRLREKADTIFAKEQEYLLQAANKNTENRQPQLYVDENGFLTQTRPDGEEEPELYQPSSPVWDSSAQLSPSLSHIQPQTQPGSTSSSRQDPTSLRIPLRTLSLKPGDLESPESPVPSPRRRLVKGQRPVFSPPDSPTLKSSVNVFDVLQGKTTSRKEKKPLQKSEFIEGEAEESDDDEVIFRRSGDGEEEEDDEDQDQSLQTLVDDQEMDENTMATAAVIEKFQEHQHQDDLEIEKLHQAAVHGQLRKKRRIGVGLDDSDDDDDIEDFRAKRMRRGMGEVRIDRGDIKDLANNPSTVPFFQVYADDLKHGDEPEFAYLLQGESQPLPEDIPMANYEEEGEGEEEQEIVTTAEVRRRAQEMARNGEFDELPSMDAEDISWIDRHLEDDEETQTKIVSIARRPQKRPSTDARNEERLSKWHKNEARSSRNAGTGRASGSTAVTAHRPSVKPTASTSSGVKKPGDARRPVKHQASVLATVATDRSSRFL
ncbi:MRC1 domain-containing protein [Mycena indigotica]|uniref:MRC1 domain-containing protein n=1 Tax=Mycena indigotica TaxID=2126181 RepID=A0A8H6W3G0_9AGAR|nr:MRC1 domain-containing protein [Mycena indigotica]KAF7301531.1 MRC1 domain-containing protein [Mycena indigotica]